MLACTKMGGGPAVVLLHGFSLNRTTWESQILHLADRYQVIAPDLPGLGESPALPEGSPVTMESMARSVLDLLDSLRIRGAAIAGHSMGGYVTLALHKLAPERVAGLGLVASQADPDTPEARANRISTAERVGREGATVVAEGMGTKLFAPAVPVTDDRYQSVQATIRKSAPRAIQDCLLAMAAREDMRPRLSGLNLPALVVAGRRDQLIPVARSEFIAQTIPSQYLTAVFLEDAGHMPMLEAPASVNGAFDLWLRRVYA